MQADQSTSRARGTGRHRLLIAARDVFSEKGYARTSLREIAVRAGISEPMAYRYFASKQKLFQAAIVEPFNEFIAGYADRAASRPDEVGSPELEVHRFYGDLFDVFSSERRLLLVLLAAQGFEEIPGDDEDEHAPTINDVLEGVVGLFEEWIAVEAEDYSFASRLDLPVLVRLALGMVLAMTVHADWTMAGQNMSRERILQEMTTLTLYGIQRPAT